MKVLLIDDNASVSKMISEFLDLKGHECVVSNDGRNGLELMKSQKFDVVILDLAMPYFSGFDIIDALSKSGEIKNQKIVVLTAVILSNEQIGKMLSSGVKSFLQKPVSPDILFQTLFSVNKS